MKNKPNAFIIRKCDAIHASCGRNRDFELLSEFVKFCTEIEERPEDAVNAFLRIR